MVWFGWSVWPLSSDRDILSVFLPATWLPKRDQTPVCDRWFLWGYTQELKEPETLLWLPSDTGDKSSFCLMTQPGPLAAFTNKGFIPPSSGSCNIHSLCVCTHAYMHVHVCASVVCELNWQSPLSSCQWKLKWLRFSTCQNLWKDSFSRLYFQSFLLPPEKDLVGSPNLLHAHQLLIRMSVLAHFLSFVQFQGWPVSHAQAGHDTIHAWQPVLNSLPSRLGACCGTGSPNTSFYPLAVT